ncbi:pseudouridine synthase [Caloranaerobacter azorensis H53214]|uniref:Pseudouridine synthase n=1 Tax=Caloranaerobacter azorensis H53214 TaxID=1156417 RepID=A0A096CUT1_9FIRM|nr:pseudouridine synthase [Caloranaerobacter azorensis]KGG80314.1 pseudouridine synthase [Caloranaerobacter azorensis H53214]
MDKKIRLDKILSNLGYGSRKDIKKMVKSGLVKVDGEVVKDSSYKLNPYKAVIEIGDTVVEYREFVYLMMNKPKGVVSSTDDPLSRTVIDLIDEKYRVFNPFPVGRLDKDTEGLLIISNDGKLAHNLLSPKKHVEKKYYVEVEGYVTDDDKKIFAEGVVIDGEYKTMPAYLEIIETDNISRVYLTIKEGKFHQVKKMFKAVNKRVVYLKRVSMGRLDLDESLLPGEYRELTEEEILLLKNS